MKIKKLLLTILVVSAIITVLSCSAIVAEYKSGENIADGVYLLEVGGHKIEYRQTSVQGETLSGSIFVDDKLIDDKADWRYISDGTTLFYSANSDKVNYGDIYKVNLDTLDKEFIINCENAWIEDCYEDKYLYFMIADNTEIATGVYDLETNKIMPDYIKGKFYLYNGNIFTDGSTGTGICAWVYQYNLDGSNQRLISDKAIIKTFVGNNMLYVREESDNSGQQLMKYNITTEKSNVLTDIFYKGFVNDTFSTGASVSYFNYLNGYEDVEVKYREPIIDVSLRAVSDVLGYDISWSDEERTAYMISKK